jgi:hypothetical protein
LASDIENIFSAIASGFSQFAQSLSQIPSSVTNFFQSLGAAIFGAFAALGKFFKDAWDDFINGLATVGSWFYDALERVAGFFEWIWHNLVSFFSWLAQVIWNALVTLAHWIVDAFNAVANFIVQHINQTIGAIDSALYGLWCNFRGKLQQIITANVAEVLIYKSIESAAEGRTQLRGLGDWLWFVVKIMGAPFVGQLAAYTLDMVLPQCGTRTSSFLGQFTMPVVSPITLSTPSLSVVPAPSFIVTTPSPVSTLFFGASPVGYLTSATSLDVVFTYSISPPSLPPVTVPLDVGFTYSTAVVYVTSPSPLSYSITYTYSYSATPPLISVSAAVPLSVAFSYVVLSPPLLSTTSSLQVAFTYSIATPVSASATNALSVLWTYKTASPLSASATNALSVLWTYKTASPLSASATNALSVLWTYSAQ